MIHGLQTTLELDTCIVIFGHDIFRPHNCVFISKWTGEAMNLTIDEFIEGIKQTQAWKAEHPELVPAPKPRRGRPAALAALERTT